MERQLKERIVGAIVIVALGIIVIPWLLDGPAQSPRPVERALELPPAEQPGRTYTIPLDPAAGPPIAVDSGPAPTPAPRPGAGAIQRPGREPTAAELQPQPAPVEPPPRAAPQPAPQAAPRPAPQAAAASPPPAPTPAPAGDGPWTVQVGSFSQPQNADGLQRELRAQGYEAFVSRIATDAGSMYRVRVGPVSDRQSADDLLARLRAAGHAGARVARAQD
jgi:DedD protein